MTQKILMDFNDQQSGQWQIINDRIMGGLSRSLFDFSSAGKAIFRGRISMEKNGGFASVCREPVDCDLAGYSGVRLRVRGDGRKYQFRVRADDFLDGIVYWAEFQTHSGRWQTITMPFSTFLPTYHGQMVADVPGLQPAHIKQVGFHIADKQDGNFRLEIDWIQVYK